jgi:hypothetical protein
MARTPAPKRVRLRLWAHRQAWSEVDFGYDYSPAQWSRIERNVEQRTQWLMILGPRPKPLVPRPGDRGEGGTDARSRFD